MKEINLNDAAEVELFVSDSHDLSFKGVKIAEECDKGIGVNFWTVLMLYVTTENRFVCRKIEQSNFQGHQDNYQAMVCDTVDEVIEFFGFSDLAKGIYKQAGIKATVSIK